MRSSWLVWLFWLVVVGCDVRATGTGGLRRFEEEKVPLVGILVTPEEVIVPLGSTVQLRATGLYEDRTSEDLTYQVEWRTSDEGVADIGSDLDAEGQLTGGRVGSAQVWAKLDGVASPEVTVTVTEAFLDGLTIEPTKVTVEPGQSVQLSATARFSDGARSDASAQVRWITDDASVATIEDGKLVGQGAGSTTVRAQWFEVLSNDVPVDVVAEALPDLRITEVQAWPSGDEVTISADVENVGNGSAAELWIDLFLDSGTPGIGDIGDDFERIDYIGPGEIVTVTFELAGLDSGRHDVELLVDTNDEVEEANEGNNLADTSFDITGGTLPPDLVVDVFTYVGDGWDIYYWVEISNYGDEPTGAFYVDLYIDELYAPLPGQEGDWYYDIPSIDAWSTIGLEFLVPGNCFYCWSWVYADSFDEVAETYESDNLAGPLLVNN